MEKRAMRADFELSAQIVMLQSLTVEVQTLDTPLTKYAVTPRHCDRK